MILYCNTATPRIHYMAEWLGNYLFGSPLQVITDRESVPEHLPVFNYSAHPLPFATYQIMPSGLLSNEGITSQEINITHTGKFPLFFRQPTGHPFDLLAAVFYLVTRYEEYLPHEKDEYGRFAVTNSLAFKHGFLKRPLIDEWMLDLKIRLAIFYPGIEFLKKTFKYLPTYDIDLAWSYLNKGFLRNTGGLLKQALKGQWKNAGQRLRTLTGKITDPFDVFAELAVLNNHYALKPVYFMLLASKNQGYDKNISPRKMAVHKLAGSIASRFETGIHLSWQAYLQPSGMIKEKQLLETMTRKPVVANRMHYIKFDLPATYEQLEALSIKKEYSMGYGSINGFRASTCTPFFWYNLAKETTSTLEVLPFAFMDANSIFEQKDDPQTALEELQGLHNEVKKLGGTFITIFHNHLVDRSMAGRSWWNMYWHFLEKNYGQKKPTFAPS